MCVLFLVAVLLAAQVQEQVDDYYQSLEEHDPMQPEVMDVLVD